MANGTTNGGYAEFMKKKEQLAQIIEKSTGVISKLDMEKSAENLSSLAAKVGSDTFKVQIVGSFSNGKSSLINSLLGGEYLPAYALPCTAIINEIKYADERKAVLHFQNPLPEKIPEGISRKALAHIQQYNMKNVPPMDIPYDEIEDYTCIPMGADINQTFMESPYQKIELFWPLDLLKNGVEIIDTPGLDDVATRTRITTDYLKKADAILFLMSADHVCGAEEMKFVENNLKDGGFEDIFFIVNKFDTIRSQREQEKMKMYVKQRVSEYTSFGEEGIYFLSALDALDGKMNGDDALYEKSGMQKFERELANFLTKDRGRVKLAQPARELKRVLYTEAIEKTIPQQKNMLSMSLDEVKQKYNAIKPKIDRLTQRKGQMEQILDVKIENAMHNIRRCINKFYIGLNDKIPVWTEEYAPKAELGLIPTKKTMQPVIEEISAYLQDTIEEEQRRWNSEELSLLINNEMSNVFGSVEADVSRMLEEIDAIKFEMSGESVKSNSDVPMWQRVVGAAGGALLNPGLAVSGAVNGVGKDMAKTLAAEVCAGGVLAFIGLLNPLTIVAVWAAAGVWNLISGSNRKMQSLKSQLSDTVLKQLDETRESTLDKMMTDISANFSELAQTIITALDNEIGEEKHQLDVIMSEMQKGQTTVDEKLALIKECETQLKALHEETDNFYFDLINGI